MMRALIAAAPALIGLATPALAQDRNSEVEALRAELRQAQETIQRLEKRLDALAPAEAGASPDTANADISGNPTVDMTIDAPPDSSSGTTAIAEMPDAARPKPVFRPVPSVAETPDWELAPPGPIDRPLAPPREGGAAAFELVAGSGGGRASFALSQSRDGEAGPPSGGAARPINDTVSLTFSAPLSKDGDTPFATLDGLASGTKLEFGFTQFRGRIPTLATDDSHPLLIKARARCAAAVPAYGPGCVRLNKDFQRKFFLPEELAEYKRDFNRASLQKGFAWSLRAALGHDEFAFYPLPGLAKTSVEKLSFSGGAGFTFFPFDRASAGVDIDYERSFEARKAVTTCPVPSPGAVSVSCVPGPLLGPQQGDKLIIAPELRYLLHVSDNGLIRNLGFAPRLEADVLTRDLSIDFPVYFAADEKNGLIGGARLGYLIDEDEVKFSIFIGKSFSLFK